MASRKKVNPIRTVEPAIEQLPEQPIILNDVPVLPLNDIPVRVERDSDRRPSSVRTPSKGNKGGAKGGAKSDGGKRVSSKSSSNGGYFGTPVRVSKKKKPKKIKLTVKGNVLGAHKYSASKKTTKRGGRKRGPTKRI